MTSGSSRPLLSLTTDLLPKMILIATSWKRRSLVQLDWVRFSFATSHTSLFGSTSEEHPYWRAYCTKNVVDPDLIRRRHPHCKALFKTIYIYYIAVQNFQKSLSSCFALTNIPPNTQYTSPLTRYCSTCLSENELLSTVATRSHNWDMAPGNQHQAKSRLEFSRPWRQDTGILILRRCKHRSRQSWDVWDSNPDHCFSDMEINPRSLQVFVKPSKKFPDWNERTSLL